MTARLLIRTADGTVQSIDVGEGLEIGSAATNDLVLTESDVAPVHARVGLTDGAPWVEDAGTRAGTSVNGEPVTRRGLKHFDVVTLGRQVNLVFLQTENVPAVMAGQGTLLFSGDAAVPSELFRFGGPGDSPAQATQLDAGAAPGPPGDLLMSNVPGGLPPDAILGFREVGPPPNPAPSPDEQSRGRALTAGVCRATRTPAPRAQGSDRRRPPDRSE